jgi:4-hydroxythreonine-4-phosphate dehydrogenase
MKMSTASRFIMPKEYDVQSRTLFRMPLPPIAPPIALTLGDPGGIGAETIVKHLAMRGDSLRLFGRREPLELACRQCDIPLRVLDHLVIEDCGVGASAWTTSPNARAGEASFRWVEEAIACALLPSDHPRHAQAIVTGPISKHAWALAGHASFPGHTELLAARCHTADYAMMFHAAPHESALNIKPGLNVILVTAHIPLIEVAPTLTSQKICRTILLGQRSIESMGYLPARIAVCGLNPHAGEEGLLGYEDSAIIAEGIRLARQQGASAEGPFPADTIFFRALEYPRRRAEFDLVVAMYHDQGLIPLKTLAWDRAVNLTLGLPIIRTSPDHGTAFNIVGQNVASAGSLTASIELAATLARARRDEGQISNQNPNKSSP